MVGDRAETQQLDQRIDAASFLGVGTPQAADRHQVRPYAATRVTDPMSQHEVISNRQAREQLRMLEGPRQTEGSARLRPSSRDVIAGHDDLTTSRAE
jgi:hypothetical protein